MKETIWKWMGRAASLSIIYLSVSAIQSCGVHVDPMVITGDSLDLIEHSVVTTYHALIAAEHNGQISQDVVNGWNKDFYPRYLASYHTACDTWRAARAEGNGTKQQEAAAIISTIVSDLAKYSSIVMLAPSSPAVPDGGSP